MCKAGAGEKTALKSEEKLPEWARVVREYVELKKKGNRKFSKRK